MHARFRICVCAENERAPGYTVVVIDTKARVAGRTAIVKRLARKAWNREQLCIARRHDPNTKRDVTDGTDESRDFARNLRSNVIAGITPRLITAPRFLSLIYKLPLFSTEPSISSQQFADLQFRLVILHAFIRALVHEADHRANVINICRSVKVSENASERIISFSVRNSYERQRLHDSVMERSSA